MSTQSLQNFSQSISASSWCPGSVATAIRLCQAVGMSLKLWLVNNGDHHNRSYRSVHKPPYFEDTLGTLGPSPPGYHIFRQDSFKGRLLTCKKSHRSATLFPQFPQTRKNAGQNGAKLLGRTYNYDLYQFNYQ
jgi:hypothetical protein